MVLLAYTAKKTVIKIKSACCNTGICVFTIFQCSFLPNQNLYNYCGFLSNAAEIPACVYMYSLFLHGCGTIYPFLIYGPCLFLPLFSYILLIFIVVTVYNLVLEPFNLKDKRVALNESKQQICKVRANDN
ncbi:hypothetical protein RchiOBHm_Chr3g0447671 [Rosa chinensis]|uniref:Uncharacterized protein n=1 Tax=Rosa chinensis TaxID=74649 RepID=A0A2P6R507_ROSCH|nr:hypothetical protein RchiOBHm_Chr3g0447671 [Rosa chinensis]